MEDVVIISGVRTPIGKFQGSLEPLSAPQLGAIAVREAVKRAKVEPAQVDECIMGLVIAAGLGQNPARQAALGGGLANTVGAMTINKVCGSGLKAVALATQAIQTGNAEMVVAGGMESMTNAPYLLPKARAGYRAGDKTVVDNVALTLHRGEIVGFLGPNGSGKTTTIRTCSGSTSPTAGPCSCWGLPIRWRCDARPATCRKSGASTRG
jgi:acetyl-CoA acetyltransferase